MMAWRRQFIFHVGKKKKRSSFAPQKNRGLRKALLDTLFKAEKGWERPLSRPELTSMFVQGSANPQTLELYQRAAALISAKSTVSADFGEAAS
jgi:hypothetical protein